MTITYDCAYWLPPPGLQDGPDLTDWIWGIGYIGLVLTLWERIGHDAC